MFEELKNKLDSLAQEVALLKEQQALQTGECSVIVWRDTPKKGPGWFWAEAGKKAQFPASAKLRSLCFHMVPWGRLPDLHLYDPSGQA